MKFKHCLLISFTLSSLFIGMLLVFSTKATNAATTSKKASAQECEKIALADKGQV